MRARIEAAIATGTWRELKAELSLNKAATPAPPKQLTLADYAPIFLDEMKRKNRRPDFHEIQIRNILPILGELPLKSITVADALRYRAARPANLKPGTVNRGVAVLRSMLSYAVKDRLIPPPNPPPLWPRGLQRSRAGSFYHDHSPGAPVCGGPPGH